MQLKVIQRSNNNVINIMFRELIPGSLARFNPGINPGIKQTQSRDWQNGPGLHSQIMLSTWLFDIFDQ